MNRLQQLINTALLIFCAAGIAALWLHATRDVGVRCLDSENELVKRLQPDRPGYCIAIAPAHLDRN